VKSGKQRRAEIKARRLDRAAALAVALAGRQGPLNPMMPGAVPADPARLAHNNTYDMLPLYYLDRAFTCRDCGSPEVWTAKQQKWWYEVAGGNINSQAVRCRPCRKIEQARVAEARRVSAEGLARKESLGRPKVP
jgi:hypothetical protein